MSSTTLSRPSHDAMIAGVCAGIAQRFGWNVTLVRALAIASCLLPGPQFILYIAMWIIMPKAAY
ncbi:PspC domain-containing protein [Nocardioides insulae]|uniref:PspC domain-containing protein n=1 Tax=Nocardioides insulae TaxID=394734 RepID=UPI00055B2B3E|nr:PspC domain-containing protein [Nocardioides insulae]